MSTEHLLGTVGTILDALMGFDNQARRLAEAEITTLTTRQPGEILLLLAQIGAQGVGGYQVDHRFLSLLLLKRLAFAELPDLHLNPNEPHPTAPFDYIAESMRGRIETVLCAGLQDEMNIRMRKGLGTCLGLWAIKSDTRQRPVLRLPPVLLALTRSPHPFHRFTPFQLLDTIPTLLVDSVTDPLPPHAIAQLLLGGLHDPSLDVRVEAVKAVKGVLMQAFRPNERNQIGPSLVVEMFNTIAPLPPALMSIALSALVELAVYYPDLFIPALPSILPFLLSLLSPPAQHPPPIPLSPYPSTHWRLEEWINLCNPVTELLLNLLEVRRAQLVAWEEGRLGRELLGLLIARQIVEFEQLGDDCTEWLQTDDPEAADLDYPESAELSLDRLSMILGGEQVVPTLSQHAQALLQRPEWRCRYVALMAIQATCEGSAEEMGPRLQEILSLISATSEDPYPRVKWGFLYCLGQLGVDCDGRLQRDFSPQVLDVCGRLFKDEHARIRAQAAACLGMFLNQAILEQVEPYIGSIVPALLESYHNGPNYLKVNVIAALANLGSVVGTALAPHYRSVMDLLLQILLVSHSKEERALVAETLHAASLIGQAVGKATFSSDAVRLATIMIGMQNTVTDPGDPRGVELMSAWFKLCAVLGDDFVPFIQHVMPPIIHAAAFEPPPSALREPDDDAALVSEPSGNERSIEVVHTAELAEKAVAFDNLSSYAALLPKHFGPFLDVSMKLAIDGLSFEYDENVRESAAFLIPSLLRVAKETNAWTTPEPLQHTFRFLIHAIKNEGDYTYLPVLFKAFSDSVTVVAQPLPEDIAAEFFDSTCAILDQWIEVRKERRAMEASMDPGDREFLRDEEAEEDLCLDNALEAAQEVLRVAGGEGTTEHGLAYGVARVEGKVAAARSAGEMKPVQ